MIRFEVPGEPQALKRARFGRNKRTGRPQTFDPAENGSAKAQVLYHWRQAGADDFDRHVPLRLEVRCHFKRPASHFGTGRNAATLKPSAPEHWHSQRPDGDNLLKLVKDALNEFAWHDDAQVADARVTKVWCHPARKPGTEILIEALPEGG